MLKRLRFMGRCMCLEKLVQNNGDGLGACVERSGWYKNGHG